MADRTFPRCDACSARPLPGPLNEYTDLQA